MYTSHQLGKELLEKLSEPYDPNRVSEWARDISCNHRLDIPQELSDLVFVFELMALGVEYTHSQQELLNLANKLINKDKDPLQQIRDKERMRECTYTKSQFIKELQEQLSKPYDSTLIADWAWSIYSDHGLGLTKELHDVVDTLGLMSMGPEFEYSQEELLILVDKMSNNEHDPLQQIRNKKREERAQFYTYTSEQLGEELKEHVMEPYDPIRVSRWAYNMYYNRLQEIRPELESIIPILEMMSLGSEFAYSQEELLSLADKLINKEKDPFQQLRDKNSIKKPRRFCIYTRPRLGRELKENIAEPYDPVRLKRWVYLVYNKYLYKMPRDICHIVEDLSRMIGVFTKEELLLIADKLINNEKKPFRTAIPKRPKYFHK